MKELICDLKKILPQTVIWAGGPEVSYDAEKFLQELPEVTGVMCGEGEQTFLELVQHYVHEKRRMHWLILRELCFKKTGRL